MEARMRATVFHSPKDFSLETVPAPAIKNPGDAIIRVTMNSICGSDVHLVHGVTAVDPGTHMGHELVGVVEKVGGGVIAFKPGDRVAVPTFIRCGFCYYCAHGSPSQCENGGILGFGPSFGGMGGAWADYCHVPFADANLCRIPDSLTDEDCLLVGDVLSTAYFGLEKAMIRPGDAIAVIGPGPVGLSVQALAPLFGVGKVIMVGTRESRLDISRAMGAVAVNPKEEDAAERVRQLTHGRGADAVLECVGSPESWALSLELCRRGGNISLLGVFGQKASIPLDSLSLTNHFIHAGLVNCDRMGELVSLIEAGRVGTGFLITHRMALADIKEAYHIFENRVDNCLKVAITP